MKNNYLDLATPLHSLSPKISCTINFKLLQHKTLIISGTPSYFLAKISNTSRILANILSTPRLFTLPQLPLERLARKPPNQPMILEDKPEVFPRLKPLQNSTQYTIGHYQSSSRLHLNRILSECNVSVYAYVKG